MKFTRMFAFGLFFAAGIWGGVAFAQAEVEKSIYIPYHEFWRVFEQENRGVFLPYESYQKLVEQARDAAKVQEPSALKGTLISELAGELAAGETVASGTIRMTVEAFSDGWHDIPLRLNEVTIANAQLDDTPARIRRDEKMGYVLMLEQKKDQPSRHVLSLTFSVPLQGETEKKVQFALPDVAVNRWTFKVPEAGVAFGGDSPVAVTRLKGGTTDQGSTVELLLAGHRQFLVKWTPEVEGAKNLQPVMQAELRQEFFIDPDIVRSAAEMVIRIDRAAVAQVTLRLSADEKVVNVASDRMRSWTVQPAENGQQDVVVLFQEPVKGAVSLRLDSERYQLPALWAAPVISVQGVARQLGTLLVLLNEDLRAEPQDLQGLSRLDLSAPQRVKQAKGNPSAGWHYRALPASLNLAVEAVQPEIRLETQSVVHLDPQALTQWVRARFVVERSGVFQLSLLIPEGFELLDAAVEGGGATLDRQVTGEAAEGFRRVDFDFASRVKGEMILGFRLKQTQARETLLTPTGEQVTVEIPVVRGAGAAMTRDEGRLVIGSPAFLALRVTASEGLREEPWQASGLEAALTANTQPQLGFYYSDAPVRLSISAQRKEPFVTVKQMLVMQAQSGVVKFHADLDVQVQYSGIRSLRLDVPTVLKDRIRILKGEIRKQELTEAPDLKEGMTAWILEGPAEFIGTFTLPLEWEEALPGMDVGVQQAVVIPYLIPRNVDRTQGQIVLRKAESMDVIVEEAGPELTPVDPRHDLMDKRQIPDAALAFAFQRDWALTATLVKYEPVDVKATSIDRGWVRQVITRSGEVSVQAFYQLRSTRQRLELRLPPEAEFDAQPLHVNGRAVSLERGGEGQVYLPLTGFKADQAVLLELRYNLRDGGRVLRLPHFPEDPAVQKIYLSVHVPENKVYLGHRGGWNPEYIWRVTEGFRLMPSGNRTPDSLWAWVNDGVGVEDDPLDRLPTDGQRVLYSTLRPDTEAVALRISSMSVRIFYILLIGLGLGLGLLLVRATVRTRLMVSVLLLAGLTLAGVFMPSLAHAVVNDATAAAALLVVLIWGVYDLVVRLPAARKALPERTPERSRVRPVQAPPARPIPPPIPPPAAESASESEEDRHDG